MDVRCEKCQTEYEFDDARITEAGVTVKCTTCGHVFKVKKKSAAEAAPTLPPVAAPGPTASAQEKQREWKVKQANGNVFTFKELTTLQKWIVERKVSRDDEISLTGESWKRLGNIAELASFFQVVEEAQKAAQLSALQSGGYLAYNPPGPSGPQPMPMVPSPVQPAPVVPAPAPAPVPVAPPPVAAPPPVDLAPPPPSSSKHQTMSFGAQPPQSTPVAVPPSPRRVMSAQRRSPADDDEAELEAAGLRRKKSGGAGTFLVVLLLLAVLGGGGYFGYFHYWLPMEQQKADAEKARKDKEEQDRLAAIAAEKEKERLAAVVDAGAPIIDAGTAEVVVDAGMPVVDAGTVAPVKKEPVRDFDWYVAQGDRLRDRERPEAALDMYGKAADMQPDRAEPLAGKGLALLDMGQKGPAEASFKEALKLNPRYGVAIMGLAETYKEMGRKPDALKYYERYLDVLPNGPEAPVATEAIRRLKSE